MTADKDTHPAKLWPNTWLWHDRSDQPESIQIIDLLHDVRLLLLIITACVLF